MELSSDCPVVILTSGQTLRVRQIMLYDEEKVIEVNRLRAQAAKSLGGTGVGLGVLGTPSLSFAAEAAAVGIVSGILANAAQKVALATLQKANEQHYELSRLGRLFDSAEVENITHAAPGLWVGYGPQVDRPIRVSDMSRNDRDAFLAQHNKTNNDIHSGFVQIPVRSRFILNSDEFLNFTTDVGKLSLRWSQVVAYFPPQ